MAAVELRPLSIGELLDRTFSYYRRHFLLFVGIMALPQGVIIGASVMLQVLRLNATLQPGPRDPAAALEQFSSFFTRMFITAGFMFVVMFVVYSIVHGATAYALSEVHLGRTTTIVGAFRALRGKVWRLLDVVFSIGLRIFGVFAGFMALMLLMIGAMSLTSQGGRPDPVFIILVVLLMFAGIIGVAVLSMLMVMRYALSVPALVLENIPARQAIRRSVALAKGNLGRIFLIMLLMYLINMAVAALFQGPFMVAMFVVGARNGVMPLWISLPMTVSGGIGGALVGPLMVIGLTLLYVDARVRKEGFDLQIMLAGLDQGGAAPPANAVISPAMPPAPST